jgi:hypothetical protein
MDGAGCGPYGHLVSAIVAAGSSTAASFPVGLWIMVALRVAWLLPDWLAKWQRLLERRRLGLANRRDA